ncbi:MAG: GIY-YIG nuclease family protein [Peptostreptococcaceae bacterium]
MNEFCVYKMFDKDGELLYVGKTKNINARMTQHFAKGKKREIWKDDVDSIVYTVFKNECDMTICEIYLIGVLKPKYNKEFKNKYKPTVKIDKFEDSNRSWKNFGEVEEVRVFEYEFFNELSIEDREYIRDNIKIYEGKMNTNFFERRKDIKNSILSEYWISRKDITKLRKNIVNLVKNVYKVKSNEVLCITSCQGVEKIKAKGFASSTYPESIDPSKAENKIFIAYIYGGGLKDSLKREIKEKYGELNDLHYLINLLQFIWRSGIREGKPIDLYIPSRRMRELLKDYLEGKI